LLTQSDRSMVCSCVLCDLVMLLYFPKIINLYVLNIVFGGHDFVDLAKIINTLFLTINNIWAWITTTWPQQSRYRFRHTLQVPQTKVQFSSTSSYKLETTSGTSKKDFLNLIIFSMDLKLPSLTYLSYPKRVFFLKWPQKI
jgi:hypothetical protein